MAQRRRVTARPIMTVVCDDTDVLDLLREVCMPTHRVKAVPAAGSMTGIAAQRPDIVIIGPATRSAPGSSLRPWELVALVRSHRDLRAVPVLVLSADIDAVLAQPSLLTEHDAVWVLGLPTDLETLTSVVTSVQRGSHSAAVRLNHLPELCAHGYGYGADGQPTGCGVCCWSA